MNIYVSPSKRPSGFTLVELLIVIAIIAILAAMLLPALAAAKVKAQQVKCVANVKQMDLALVMYPTDYQEQLIPDIDQKTMNAADTGAWMINLIDFYSRATNLFMCPANYEVNPLATPAGANTIAGTGIRPWASRLPRGAGNPYYFGSYGYNGWAFSDINPATGKHYGDGVGIATLPDGVSNGDLGYFTKMSAVRWASTTPMFYDQNWTDAWPIETSPFSQNLFGRTDGTLSSGGANSMCRIAKARHGGGGGAKAPQMFTTDASTIPKQLCINMGFADGHAETVKLAKLWYLNWHAKWAQNKVPALNSITPIAGN